MSHSLKKQHTLWLLAALAAPLAHYSGSGWLVTALAALAVLPLTALPKRWDGQGRAGALVQLLWIGVIAGALLRSSAAYWPSDNALAVPLTLLVLAALTDAAAAPRVGAVLAFCMALTAIPGVLSGAARAEPDWLRPVSGPWPWMLCLVLLLPNLPAAGETARSRGGAYAAALAALLAALVQGTISARVAAAVPDPFYQTARTLGRLEPVLAAGITLGWYALTGYLLHSARSIAQSSGLGNRWATVLVTGTAALVLLTKVQLPQPSGALFSGLLWVLVPLLNKIKNVEKNEN